VDDVGLPKLEKVLAKFPNLTFLGHSQPFWAEISADVTQQNRNSYPKGPVTPGRVPELMRRYPNLCGDMSAGSGFNAVSRDPSFGYEFMDEFQDRLFFGTDICAPHNETPLVGYLNDAVAQGKISREVYDKITSKNAIRLLGLKE
jgi:predicted TIM-barrel fold metal-dependent hydrolase